VWKRCNGEGLLLGSYALYYYKDKNQAAVRCPYYSHVWCSAPSHAMLHYAAQSYKKPLIKFSKPKDDPRAMGRINMTFAHKEAFTTREKVQSRIQCRRCRCRCRQGTNHCCAAVLPTTQETIALAMEKQAIPQSKQFVRLASPNRIFSVAAESDENLDEVRPTLRISAMLTHRALLTHGPSLRVCVCVCRAVVCTSGSTCGTPISRKHLRMTSMRSKSTRPTYAGVFYSLFGHAINVTINCSLMWWSV